MTRLACCFALIIACGCSFRIKPDHGTNDGGTPDSRKFTTNDQSDVAASAPTPSDPNLNDSSVRAPEPPPAVVAGESASAKKSQREKVRRLIMARKLDIRACYTKTFGIEKHHGQVIFEWEYNERGRVVGLSLAYTDFKRPSFERCIERIIRTTTFPKSRREMVSKVRYPFEFQ